jgi:hypothetical protein
MAGVASTIWTVGLRMSQKKAVPNDFISSQIHTTTKRAFRRDSAKRRRPDGR